jgi:ribonuclease BN (tRNA processing enzyme)
MNLSLFNHLIKDNKQIPVNGKKYALKECMVIRMAKANHGNSNCISYRFEEMPTGKTFVFCTDHEDMTGIPSDFNKHLSDADLLIIDAQYNDEKYMKQTAGFGHGTPFGAIKQGMQARVQRVGLTHHDPMSTDDFLESSILEEGWSALETLVASTPPGDAGCSSLLGQDDIFLCRDYDEIAV